MPHSFSLQMLCDYLHTHGVLAQIIGNPEHIVTGLGTLKNATPQQISFLNNPRYRSYLEHCQAGAIIMSPKESQYYQGNRIITDAPYIAWARISQQFSTQPRKQPGIHPTAIIAETAIIGKEVCIEAYAVIGDHTVIGDRSVIGAHCVIEEYCTLGNDCYLYPRVTIAYHCHLGQRVILHSGVVIGGQGFGFAPSQAGYIDVAQIGRVILEDDVNIGVNSCVDRGAIEDTYISKGCKIDNLVQIAHNVRLGEHTVMAGCSAISGSTTVGKHVVIGGGAGLNGHIDISDHVTITGFSMVTHTLHQPGVYSSGLPIMENKKWHRLIAQIKQINNLYQRVKYVEQKLDISSSTEEIPKTSKHDMPT